MHVPDQQKEAYNLDHKVALPERKLKLQWVYPCDLADNCNATKVNCADILMNNDVF